MIELDKRAADPEFVDGVVAQMSFHCGHNSKTGSGRSVALRIVDYVVERVVFVHCCWTGKKKGVLKCNFGGLSNFQKLFFEIVRYSDPKFTLDEMNSFFTFCMNNAAERAKSGEPTKLPSERNRPSNKRKRLSDEP